MTVPFFAIDERAARLAPHLRARLADVFSQSKLVGGDATAALERALSAYIGDAHVIAVNSATDALILALKAAGIGPDDEVIVPAYSFFATVSSVVHAGATPVFADIEPGTYSMNVEDTRARITSRTRAIMPVHLFSQMADMAGLSALCRDHGLLMIEDSAEGIGMNFDGVHAGLWGDAGVLSFFPTKTLGGIGDGGAILTRNEDIAVQCRHLRDLGRDGCELSIAAALSSRMDDVQAAFLELRLAGLDDEIAERGRVARRYNERLGRLAPRVVVPAIAPRGGQSGVWYVYLIECEERDGLVAALAKQGITTETYYPVPLHLQPCCRQFGYRQGDMPVAELVAGRALGLPIFPDMTDAMVDQVCTAIETYYER
jgi:UDP-2-acetamido-2-deoxy-ribo-hexuluronate aminotransferase